MSPTLWTFLFEVGNFVALAALLGWLFFKPIRRAIEAQGEQARKQREEAAAALAEAERARDEARLARRSLAKELEAERARSRAAAEAEAATLVEGARRDAAGERDALLREAAQRTAAQLGDLGLAAARAVREGVERLLVTVQGSDLDTALVQAACRRLRELPEGRALAPATIETARPLSAPQRACLADVLGEAMASTTIQVNPALGAGVRVATAAGLVDASAAGLASHAEATIAAALRAELSGEDARE